MASSRSNQKCHKHAFQMELQDTWTESNEGCNLRMKGVQQKKRSTQCSVQSGFTMEGLHASSTYWFLLVTLSAQCLSYGCTAASWWPPSPPTPCSNQFQKHQFDFTIKSKYLGPLIFFLFISLHSSDCIFTGPWKEVGGGEPRQNS
jgi:hypothetical protein